MREHFRGIDENIMHEDAEEYTLDWSQSKVFLIVLLLITSSSNRIPSSIHQLYNASAYLAMWNFFNEFDLIFFFFLFFSVRLSQKTSATIVASVDRL